MVVILALCGLGVLVWILVKSISTPAVDPAEFQRMADEYSEYGFFEDAQGRNNCNPDTLIDMWLALHPRWKPRQQPQPVGAEKERCKV